MKMSSNCKQLLILCLLVAAGLSVLVFLATAFPNPAVFVVQAGEQVVFNVSRIVDLAYVEVVLSSPTEVEFSDKPPQHNITLVTSEMTTELGPGGSFGVTPRTYDFIDYYWNSDACQSVDPLSLTIYFQTYQVKCNGSMIVPHGFVPSLTDGYIIPLLSIGQPSGVNVLMQSNLQQSIKTRIKTVNHLRRYFFSSPSAKRSPFGSEPIKYPVNSRYVYGIITAGEKDIGVQIRVPVTFWGGIQSLFYGFVGGFAAVFALIFGFVLLIKFALATNPLTFLLVFLGFFVALAGWIYYSQKKNKPKPLQDNIVDHNDEEVPLKV